MYNPQEQKLRRRLKKIGYRLVKFRDIVDRSIVNCPRTYPGGYMIVDDSTNFVVAGGGNWTEQMTLPQVEEWLAEGE